MTTNEYLVKTELASIPKILKFFNLPEQSGQAVVLKEGMANHNYDVNTITGQHYVVKFLINIATTSSTLENEIAIQRQLKDARIGTVYFIQNSVGNYIYEDNHRRAVISQKLFGVHPMKVNALIAHEIGNTLATFHTSVKYLPNPHKSWLNVDVVNTNLVKLTDPKIANKIRTLISSGQKVFDLSLPTGVIHGDFWESNLLINQETNKIVAMLDYEEAENTIFILDLARTIINACVDNEKNKINSELVRSFVDGYSLLRPITQNEQSQLPNAIAYVASAGATWFLINGFDKKYAIDYIDRAKNFPKNIF